MDLNLDKIKNQISLAPLSKDGKKKYDDRLQSQVLRYISRSSLTIPQVCQCLGISVTTVYGWKRRSENSKKSKNFKKVAIVNVEGNKRPVQSNLEIVSPTGFILKGSYPEILKIWRETHASIAG